MHILASAATEIPFAAVQPQASADGRCPVFPATMSEMYSVEILSSPKNFTVIQLRSIEWLVECKIETENQRLLSTCPICAIDDLRTCQCPAVRSAATRKVASASVCRCAKSLRMQMRLRTHPRPHISDHSLPFAPVTQHKGNVCPIQG